MLAPIAEQYLSGGSNGDQPLASAPARSEIPASSTTPRIVLLAGSPRVGEPDEVVRLSFGLRSQADVGDVYVEFLCIETLGHPVPELDVHPVVPFVHDPPLVSPSS